MNHKSKGIEKIIIIKNVEIMIMKIQPSWLKLILEYLFFVELEDMSSQNVHRLIVKWRMDLLDM
jgi:hypothetical protein